MIISLFKFEKDIPTTTFNVNCSRSNRIFKKSYYYFLIIPNAVRLSIHRKPLTRLSDGRPVFSDEVTWMLHSFRTKFLYFIDGTTPSLHPDFLTHVSCLSIYGAGFCGTLLTSTSMLLNSSLPT